MIVFPSLFSLGSLFQNQLAPHHRNRSVQIQKQSKSNLINLHAQYPSKIFSINHFLFTNHPLPQLLSLSRMHAWKLFRKHQMFSNWICFSSLRRSGPRRTRSAASEEVVTSLSDSGENPTTPVRHWHHSADISENWWNSVRTSFESWGTISGYKSDITRSASEIFSKWRTSTMPHQLLPVTSS